MVLKTARGTKWGKDHTYHTSLSCASAISTLANCPSFGGTVPHFEAKKRVILPCVPLFAKICIKWCIGKLGMALFSEHFLSFVPLSEIWKLTSMHKRKSLHLTLPVNLLFHIVDVEPTHNFFSFFKRNGLIDP